MNLNELKAKYGNAEVMVVPSFTILKFPKNCFVKVAGDYATNGITRRMIDDILIKQRPMLRCDAEINPNYKQIIPYVIIYRDNKVFCTKRLKGDERLVGQISVGTGGHLERDEQAVQGMFSELKEEVGLEYNAANEYRFEGILLDESTEVSSVHMGLVFSLHLAEGDIAVKEVDKLQGMWLTPGEITACNNIESWSKLCIPLVKELCNG